MEDKLKKIQLRDDGFLEVTLKRIKDFDDYVFQQMLNDSYCLACVRDPKTKGRLYYDTKGYLTLRAYLEAHVFDCQELVDFLIFISKNVIKVNVKKPVFLSLDHVYLHYDGKIIRFLVLPLSLDNWTLEKEECHAFLVDFITVVKCHDANEIIGLLVMLLKEEDVRFTYLLQELEKIREEHQKKTGFLKKFFHFQKEKEEYRILDIPPLLNYPEIRCIETKEDEEHGMVKDAIDMIDQKTVALFSNAISQCYFMNKKTKVIFYVNKESFTIGRSPDNDICVTEESVSSYHAIFYLSNQRLEDLHSLNGTFVNHQSVHTKTLDHLDEVMFGNEVFVFHKDGEPK